MVPAIKFIELRKTFGKRRNVKEALKGISFEVPRGEIFGFLGPNGAGKTTAMHILLGFLHPTGGRSEIMGVDSADPSARRGVGFLPEIFAFDGFLRGSELLRLFAGLSGKQIGDLERRIPELLEFLDMPDAGNVRIKHYSKGMTQKVGLAQALIGDPDLLVLDEPTSGMDPIAKAKIKQLLLRLKQEGKTVFLSSHILSDIEDLADRVAVINNGELLAVDRLKDLLAKEDSAFRIEFVGGDDKLITRLSEQFQTQREGTLVTVTCPNNEARRETIQAVVAGGGDIISVRSIGVSLQSRFLQLVEREELSND